MRGRTVAAKFVLWAVVPAVGCGVGEGGRGGGIGSNGITAGSGLSGGTEGDAGDDDDDAPGEGPGDGADPSGGTGADGVFDVGVGTGGTEGGVDECGEGYGFSIIWIANDDQGTVTKIDTMTMAKLARYYTHPSQGGGRPSRTSVNLAGDVAVTNREPGGVTKISNLRANCVDTNGNGTIDTSSGPDDVLPWGQDECVLWFTEVPTEGFNAGPRPTAWESGNVGQDPCNVTEQPRLWIAYMDEGDDSGRVWRMDGATGSVLDDVDLGFWDDNDSKGPYGGAVRPDGDFVVVGTGGDRIVRIDHDDLEVHDYASPEDICTYGIGLDQDGNMWIGDNCGKIWFFDFDDESWTELDAGGGQLYGLQVDRDGFVWAAAIESCRLVKVDGAARSIVNDNIALPGCSSPRGISIDGEGFVWVVDRGGIAFKVDPVTHQTATVTGVLSPYSYSDMTGYALGLVTDPPG